MKSVKNLILFGFKEVGKTSFGRKVSEYFNLTFIDLDEKIEERYLKEFHQPFSCRKIVKEKGELFFRALEKQIVLSLKNLSHSLIATGGGTVLDSENLLHLQSLGQFIYLKIDKDILKQRLLSKEFPSFLNSENPEETFETIYAKRLQVYEKIPSICIQPMESLDRDTIEQLKKCLYGK